MARMLDPNYEWSTLVGQLLIALLSGESHKINDSDSIDLISVRDIK